MIILEWAVIIISALVGIFLILNTIAEHKANACLDVVGEKESQRITFIYDNLLQLQELSVIQLYAIIKNISNANYIDKQFTIYTDPESRYFTERFFNLSSETQQKIFVINTEIMNKRKECRYISNMTNTFLYVAIFLNLLIISLSFFRKKFNKEMSDQ